MDDDVKFATLVDMLEAIVRSKKAPVKRKHLRTFLDHVYKDHEYFSAMRLILPELDKERATYGLKETALAKFVGEALGLSKESEDAKKLIDWRKGGKRAGKNAGNFPLVVAEVLQNRQRQVSAGITIREVNEVLDRLAAADGREEKVPILMELLNKTNIREMKWIVMIVLKELKLGISEKTVLSEFHRDAEDLFNVTCDLKLVCQKLTDRSQRYKRQDIEPGKAVRPQLASRVASAQDAWKQMRGKQVVVETKFDGDRIQVHKNGTELHFYSRSFKDHTEYLDGMSKILVENILPDKCILDGEMTVWDKSAKQFIDFGNNQTFAKAARDGVESDAQLCYIAFDVLYCDDSSVIHRPLRERHQLLLKAVRPVKGRLETLIPMDGLNSPREPGEPLWSMYAHSLQSIEHFFLETVENREEGVMVKDLESKWDPGDRSGKWLKLKPDYVSTGSDLDVLIIGDTTAPPNVSYFGWEHPSNLLKHCRQMSAYE